MKISNLFNKSYFKWRQSVSLISKTWKKVLKESQSDSSNLVLLDHELLEGALSGAKSPLKMMKNAFYFTSKALFVLKIFKFFS